MKRKFLYPTGSSPEQAPCPADCGLRDYAAVQQRKEEGRTSGTDEGERRRKRLEEMGCNRDEFERLLNEEKAAGKTDSQ